MGVLVSPNVKRAGQGSVPNALDGMGAFPMSNGNVRLVRNHEMRDAAAQTVPMAPPMDVPTQCADATPSCSKRSAAAESSAGTRRTGSRSLTCVLAVRGQIDYIV